MIAMMFCLTTRVLLFAMTKAVMCVGMFLIWLLWMIIDVKLPFLFSMMGLVSLTGNGHSLFATLATGNGEHRQREVVLSQEIPQW